MKPPLHPEGATRGAGTGVETEAPHRALATLAQVNATLRSHADRSGIILWFARDSKCLRPDGCRRSHERVRGLAQGNLLVAGS